MLCRRCAARFLPPRRLSLSPTRTFTSTTTTHHPDNPPAATSTSAAQPFSTPFTPSPSKTPGIPSGGSTTNPPPPGKRASHTPSSTLAGTPLRGLNYLKPPAPAPIALADAEYPSWLWTLLSPPEKEVMGEEEGGGGDMFAKSKKQRRMAARAARARMAGGEGAGIGNRKVERQRQSVDLAVDAPGGGGEVHLPGKGQEEREKLQRAMRRERRGKIKEGNFLRGMR